MIQLQTPAQEGAYTRKRWKLGGFAKGSITPSSSCFPYSFHAQVISHYQEAGYGARQTFAVTLYIWLIPTDTDRDIYAPMVMDNSVKIWYS